MFSLVYLEPETGLETGEDFVDLALCKSFMIYHSLFNSYNYPIVYYVDDYGMEEEIYSYDSGWKDGW